MPVNNGKPDRLGQDQTEPPLVLVISKPTCFHISTFSAPTVA